MSRYEAIIGRLASLDQDVVLVPVRHHSPGCAAAIIRLFDAVRPAQVLIEGPSDFNERLGELALAHTPPIAIYTWLRLGDGSRRGTFYPFCSYSPEWVALRTAAERGIPAAFIDLPWSRLAAEDAGDHRYTDGDLRRARTVRAVARRLGVSGFDELWDELAEIPRALAPADYLLRAHRLCCELREAEGEDARTCILRESFMAQRIAEARKHGPLPILVITGGYHSPALAERLAGSAPPDPEPSPPLDIAAQGLALTPYSYRRLDALTGYEAGMPGPAFYQRVWDERRAGGRLDGDRLIADIAGRLRDRRQAVSTADLIALRLAADGLARLRGRDEMWRTDLIDAVRATLIKDDLPERGRHPVQEELDELLRGGGRGRLAAGTATPPLVHDIRAQLEAHGLDPSEAGEEREVRFDDAPQRAMSRTLHRLRLAGITGFRRLAGTDFHTQDDLAKPWERWRIAWSPEHEASAIEASALGATLAEAAEAALAERLAVGLAATGAEQAALVAGLVLDGELAGLDGQSAIQAAQLEAAIAIDPSFVSVAQASGVLLHLFRFDQALGSAGRPGLGRLLAAAWERAVWLLDQGVAGAASQDAIAGVRTIVGVWERCGAQLGLEGGLLDRVLARVRADRHVLPVLRGAACGARWTLALDDAAVVLAVLKGFAAPEALGDFLAGVFALAREAVQRRRDVVAAIERLVDGWDEGEFLVALPSMRLAFAGFPPRERHHIAVIIAEVIGGTAPATPLLVRLPPPPEETAAGLRHEAAVLAAARRFGLRCAQWDAVATAALPAPVSMPIAETASPAAPARHAPEQRRVRWRLILGAGAGAALGATLDPTAEAQDAALDFLYRRETSPARNVAGTGIAPGGSGSSQLTVPDWINQVHSLFPRRTIERLERDALERYRLDEVVTDPVMLRRAQPSEALLKAVLHTKHLMNQEVLAAARELVRRVVQQLMDRLAVPVRQPFHGVRLRRPSTLRVARNFDARTTIRRNLAHWDADRHTLLIRSPSFISRVRRHCDRWQVIVLVDESGSMAQSVIHAAVTAAILVGLPGIRTHLVLFDTSVVDVSGMAGDPVETIMKVQLGGGTDIGQALQYAEGLIDQPRRAIVVLISDFCEGGPPGVMLASLKRLVDQGSKVLGLAALDADADPSYDRDMGARMVRLGVHVGAMTPGELAAWIGEKVG